MCTCSFLAGCLPLATLAHGVEWGWDWTYRGCIQSGYTTTVLIVAGATPSHTVLDSKPIQNT